MIVNGTPEFNIDDLTDFDNNNYCGSGFGFGRFNDQTDPSNIAGPSQAHAGADVCGELDNYPVFPPSPMEPESLYLDYGVYPREGRSLPSSQGMGVPTVSPQSATLPLPTHLLPLVPSLSPEPYIVPITPFHPYAQPQVTTNAGGLDPTPAEGFCLPDVHRPPSYEELWDQYNHQHQPSRPDPLCIGVPSFGQFTGVASSEAPIPAPVASSSGPQRTRRSAREGRRHNPIERTEEMLDSDRDGWNQSLARFRAEFDGEFGTPHSVHDGQPSGGLTPEKALASLNKFVKEDLKRSPLRATKAGEGKRSRNVEKYLEGLLQAIRPVVPTSIPGGGSGENDTTAATLSRLADELETRLTAVDQQLGLRQQASVPEAGKKKVKEQTDRQVKRSQAEQRRRENERHHLERISRLFKAPKPWLKREVLSLAVVFLLYGSAPFPQDFVDVRPAL